MLFLIALLSGVCGLGYEIVWTRALGLVLGHESAASLAVVAAFFGGLALGSLVLARPIAVARPTRFLAGLEAAIGAWAALLAWLLPEAGALFARALGPDAAPLTQWAAAFGFTFLLLLPATFAMGGTLPVLARAFGDRAESLPLAYALNTAGAVAGTLIATVLLLPSLGFARTQLLLAGLNAISAVLAWRLAAAHPAATAASRHAGTTRLAIVMAATGLLAIGYEVLCLRVVAQVFENTVFTFAALLAVFLCGNALGGGAMRGKAARARLSPALLALLTGAVCLVGLAALAHAPAMLTGLRAALGPGAWAAILAEMGCGAAVLFLPSLLMGALFARLAAEAGGALPRVLAANLAGSAAAPVLVGVVLLPLIGPGGTLCLLGAGYAAAVGGPPLPRLALAGIAALVSVLAPRLDFLPLAPGAELIAQVTGPSATVSVVRDGPDSTHLRINSHFRQGGSASAYSDRRESFVPILLHGAPRRALYLGLGTGATIGAARAVPDLSADGVELLPEVLPLLAHFTPQEGPLLNDPRLALHLADARRFVRASDASWDVIIADLYFPAVDGAGALYTREHFAAIRKRLAPDGVFCQWLPLHQMDFATLRPILRAFLDVFPDGQAWLAHYGVQTPVVGLISRARGPLGVPQGHVVRAGAAWAEALGANGLRADDDLLGLFLGGPASLARFAGTGPMNTDDYPVATWRAPLAAYAPAETPPERLVALATALTPEAADIGRPEEAARLAALWRARTAFLRAGAGFDPRTPPDQAIAELAPKLLEAVRISGDFSPAYDPLLAMAPVLARRDREAARRLLSDMRAAAPARSEAAALLQQLEN